MSVYKAIPKPTDQRNVSQADILSNMLYLQTPKVPQPGAANGVIGVDHISTGDNVQNPECGFHSQVSFINKPVSPTTLLNNVNNSFCDSILYNQQDAQGRGQMRHFNGVVDAPVTYLKAMVLFSGGGTILGNSFNIAGGVVGHPSTGSYLITFTDAMLNTDYFVIGTSQSTAGSTRILHYGTKTTTTVEILINNEDGNPRNPAEVSVMVLGLF